MIALSQLPERILRYIEPEPYSGCWLWAGSCDGVGYAMSGHNNLAVHRALYEMYIGGIEEGYEVHHKCHTRCCVNPNHLEQLSKSAHSRAHGGTHCINGHEFTPENTYWRDGRRDCRICISVRSKACRARKKLDEWAL